MHDNRLDAQRLCSQELSHVHTEVTNLSECVCVCLRACVCIWLCLLYPCNSESVNRTGTGRGPALRLRFAGRGRVVYALLLRNHPRSPSAAEIKRSPSTREPHLGAVERRSVPPCSHKGAAGPFSRRSQSRSHTGTRAGLRDKHNCSALPCSLCDTGDY